MIDYLIVGAGLAGIAFAETALQNQKTIQVIDSDMQNASKVAGGLYNPVILKRFTPVWKADEQLQLLDDFYTTIEAKLNTQFDFKIPILRKFFSVEEQNNWFIASDKIGLSPFLSLKLITTKFEGIDSPFDYGKVNHTGYVDVAALLDSYKSYLNDKQLLLKEVFSHHAIKINGTSIQYKNIEAKHIVFAEGFSMTSNPFFSDLPLDGAKGELLLIKAPNLKLDVIINTSIFMLPLGNDIFKVGSTYNWTDKSNAPTQEGKQELLDKLQEILTCDFEVISHYAGIRPTVKDRKPLVGTHSVYERVHVLNGLGSRGVMLGPAMAKELFENIELGTPLSPEVNINRFYKK